MGWPVKKIGNRIGLSYHDRDQHATMILVVVSSQSQWFDHDYGQVSLKI